eukprot:TRINITY_DN8005_c0_g2_i1.p1 TRINITY_DN8005_c0_g2~~TRINITY_DN8005_c0_g2_i1.p1  ORF type:complete len:972 (-),score=110.80 TRINITY_DN8005_c0_g2_i1:1194-4109(-)
MGFQRVINCKFLISLTFTFLWLQFGCILSQSQGDNCSCTNVPPGQEYTCEQQREWGKCTRTWMTTQDYCAQTCERCQCFGSDECYDIPPNKFHTCDQQKEWGKCDEQWMVEGRYCEITCNRCSHEVNKRRQQQDKQSNPTNPSPPAPPPSSPASSPSTLNSECGCTDTPPGRSLSCAQQSAFGKCMRQWMLSDQHCESTCERCYCLPDEQGKNTVKCTDIPPNNYHTCREQRDFGKCAEPWMNGYCDFSCGRYPQSLTSTATSYQPHDMSDSLPDEMDRQINPGVNMITPNSEDTLYNKAIPVSLPQPAIELQSAIVSTISSQAPPPPSSPALTLSQIGFQQDYSDLQQIPFVESPQSCFEKFQLEIINRPYLNIYNQMLLRSGLQERISSTDGPLTLFMPEDVAFRLFIQAHNITMQDLFVNPRFTEQIIPKLLSYHFVPQELEVDDIVNGSSVETLLSEEDKLVFIRSGDMVFIEGYASSAEIVEQGIRACDITMHVIDAILMPVDEVQALNVGFNAIQVEEPGPVYVPFPAAYNSFYTVYQNQTTESAGLPESYVLESGAVSELERAKYPSREKTCTSNISVNEQLQNVSNLKILRRIINELNLDEFLQPPVTLFAPVDSAWDILTVKLQFDDLEELFLTKNRKTLENVIQYHIVPMAFSLNKIDESMPLQSVSDSLLFIQKEALNKKQVFSVQGLGGQAEIIPNQQVQQGCESRVYLLDAALLPFTILVFNFTAMDSFDLPPPSPSNIVVPQQVLQTAPPGVLDGIVPKEIIARSRAGEFLGPFIAEVSTKSLGTDLMRTTVCTSTLLDVMDSRKELSTFRELFEQAGLTSLLNSSHSEYTLLAPTNRAIEEFWRLLGPRSQSLQDKHVLSNILGYHIVQDAYASNDLEMGMELPTTIMWMGRAMTLLVEEDRVDRKFVNIRNFEADREYILVGMGSEARFVTQDLWACDSVLHIIDSVLLPMDAQI